MRLKGTLGMPALGAVAAMAALGSSIAFAG